MKRFCWLISLLLLFISSNYAYSQIDDWLDYSLDYDDSYNISSSLSETSIFDSRNGYNCSPIGEIRFLVVFVELEYENPNDDPDLNGGYFWSVGNLPIWANELFAAYDTTNYDAKQVTKYYRYASSNGHIVLGDFLIAPDNGNMPQPHEDFIVNYIRCYKLDRGTIDTYNSINFVPTAASSKVYPHVILGGVGHTATINTPSAIWAEQSIILDKGFELSSGVSFSARIIQHGNDNPEDSPLYIGNFNN